LAPFLQALGISHAYLSPYFKARAGSTHGYDIFDHRQLNPELGDDAAFRQLCEALKKHALYQILDFVPNHMGVESLESLRGSFSMEESARLAIHMGEAVPPR